MTIWQCREHGLILGQTSAFSNVLLHRSYMYEIHLALIFAVIALWVAVKRQPRLPSHRLEWNDVLARDVYARRFILLGSHGFGSNEAASWYVDAEGWPSVDFPSVIDGEHWCVSVRFGRGVGGFRAEFSLATPAEITQTPPHRFVSVAFSPSDATIVEVGPPVKFSPPQVSVFNGVDELVANLP